MRDYVFKVLTVHDEIVWQTVTADNIKSARAKFYELSSKWHKGWCLVAVYREV